MNTLTFQTAVNPVAHLLRSSRHEVAFSTCLAGDILTKPCVSPQVFQGSVRPPGWPEARDLCQRCEAFPTMYRTWKPQSGVELEFEDTVTRLDASDLVLHKHYFRAHRRGGEQRPAGLGTIGHLDLA